MVTGNKDMLKDDSGTTGGTVISEEIGLDLKDATLADLDAKSVKKSRENTVNVDGQGAKADIEKIGCPDYIAIESSDLDTETYRRDRSFQAKS